MSEPNTQPGNVERNIEQARADLGRTVEALAHKLNVPAQVKEKVHGTGTATRARAAELQARAGVAADNALRKLPARARPPVRHALANPVPALLGAVGGLLALRWVLRGRHT